MNADQSESKAEKLRTATTLPIARTLFGIRFEKIS